MVLVPISPIPGDTTYTQQPTPIFTADVHIVHVAKTCSLVYTLQLHHRSWSNSFSVTKLFLSRLL